MTKVIVNSPQHMQIIQKKENMKISFVINIYEKLNVCGYIKYMHFCLLLVKMWYRIFQKTNFQNSKKLESIVNIFVFLEKLHVRAKNPPLSKQSLFILTPPFLEKSFYPPYCQIREVNPPPPPFLKGEIQAMVFASGMVFVFFLGYCRYSIHTHMYQKHSSICDNKSKNNFMQFYIKLKFCNFNSI